jgi:hypothetical protein
MRAKDDGGCVPICFSHQKTLCRVQNTSKVISADERVKLVTEPNDKAVIRGDFNRHRRRALKDLVVSQVSLYRVTPVASPPGHRSLRLRWTSIRRGCKEAKLVVSFSRCLVNYQGDAGRKSLVIVLRVLLKCYAKVACVVEAGSLPCLLASLRENGKKDGCKECNDCNHRKQLNQGEGFRSSIHKPHRPRVWFTVKSIAASKTNSTGQ